MNLNINYIMTQSYTTEKKVEAKDSLQKQKKSLEGVEDDAESQIFELEEALDQLVSGDISFGKYHFSLIVFGDTVQETKDNTSAVIMLNLHGNCIVDIHSNLLQGNILVDKIKLTIPNPNICNTYLLFFSFDLLNNNLLHKYKICKFHFLPLHWHLIFQ